MLFESIFLRCMPEDIRLQLATSSFDDLRALESERTVGCCFRVKHPYQEIRDTKTCDDNQLRRISSKRSRCVFLSSTFRGCCQKMRTALRFRGKRPSRSSIVATAAGATNSLLFLVDGHSAKRFLVDTGAAVSVSPASFRDINGGSHARSLVAANGSNIATYGTRRMNIRMENQDYTWPFILADVKTPLFGDDFLQANGLLVDLQSKRLVNTTSFANSTLRQSNQTSLGLHHVTSDDPYSRLLEQFPTITRPEFSSKSVRHDVEHFIQTEGPPVHARARRLPPDKLVIGVQKDGRYGDHTKVRQSVVVSLAHGAEELRRLETVWRLQTPQ